MMRRPTSALQLQLCLRTAPATSPPRTARTTATSSPAHVTARRTFFGSLGKQWGGAKNSSGDGNSSSSSSGGGGGGAAASGLPAGFDLQKLQTMQQLFHSQPKEKQEQMMKQAMDMQKMMGKIPGLGKLTQKNTELLEQLMRAAPPQSQTHQQQQPQQQQQQQQPGSPTQAGGTSIKASGGGSTGPTPARRDLFSGGAAASSMRRASATSTNAAGHSSGSGPSLDDLKRVNLGPEIEALFAELRTIRGRKNDYRARLYETQSTLEALQREHADVTAREASLRGRLAKAEQEVMLLTSENMELRDSSKNVKQLTQVNRQLKTEVEQLRSAAQSSAAPGTATHTALQQQLQEREDALRSLQRKVDRMRRRDPLLQFSLACSNVGRLSSGAKGEEGGAGAATAAGEASQEAVDHTFTVLQTKYHERQQAAWAAAARDGAAAATAFVAVVRRYVVCNVPHSNYDAVVTFTGDGAALHACFVELGFRVEAAPGEPGRVHVTAPADAPPAPATPGPFGYALALRLSSAASAAASAFAVTAAQPFVSATLAQNPRRCSVEYESARASGPGGQATNVTETQVYAKLVIDGVPAYTAEAQDSRSALSNKEAALEKLHHKRRQQFNDGLARQKAEVVQAQLVAGMRAQGGYAVEPEVQALVQEAVAAGTVMAGDAALVGMLEELGRLCSKD